MAVFKWLANSMTDAGTPDFLIPANLIDVSTETQGIAAPTSGDTTVITGIANPAAFFIPNTKLLMFPLTSAYTHVDFFAQQGTSFQYNNILVNNPNGLVGDTVQGETLYVDGTVGIPELQLQNSHLLNDRFVFTGTDLLYSTVDSSISGEILIGRPGQPSFLELEINPYDFVGVKPTDHTPITSLNASVDIGDGDTFWITTTAVGGGSIFGADLAGVMSSGAIAVRPGGAFVVEDQADGNALTTPTLATLSGEHGLLWQNAGSIDIEGAAGKTTKAVFEANTIGPGAITINGNGAAASATTLLVDGSMTGQTITVTDATVTFDDVLSAINLADGSAGFDVTGGAFTFGDNQGVLVLHQEQLSSLAFNNATSDYSEAPNGRHPFTTPISGFRAGDVIELPGKYPPPVVPINYLALYNPATNLLTIESSAPVAGQPPLLIAQLTMTGTYVASGFHLTGNAATGELDLTYSGPVPAPGAAAPGVPVTGATVSNAILNGSIAAASGVGVTGNPILYEVDGASTVQTLSLGYGLELDIGLSDAGSLTGTGSISGPANPAAGTLPLVDNFGTLDVNGSIGTRLNNDGQILVGAGERLALTGGLYSSGSLAVAANGTLSLGGAQETLQGAANNGTIDITTGTLALTAALTGSGTIIVESGATLDMSAASSVSNAIVLRAGATLKTSHATNLTGTLQSPAPSSTITLTDTSASGATVTNGQIVLTTPLGPVDLNESGVTAGTTPIITGVSTPTALPPAPGTASGTAPGNSTPATLPVYRFFDKVHGTHFFTADSTERASTAAMTAAYTEETNDFGAVAPSDPNATAVYRFFDTTFGTHFFTASAAERNTVEATRSDLTYEPNSTFYEHATQQAGDVAVYRLFDQGSGTHFYTGDPAEYAAITTPGSTAYRVDLISEGIGFYAPAGSFG